MQLFLKVVKRKTVSASLVGTREERKIAKSILGNLRIDQISKCCYITQMAKVESEKPAGFHLNEASTVPTKDTAQSLTQKSMELSDFLRDSTVDTIHVTSVIPITKMGILYSVSLYKRDLDESTLLLQTDSTAIKFLAYGLDQMSKKERKKQKSIIKNLKAIQEVALNPLEWNKPFNVRKDH